MKNYTYIYIYILGYTFPIITMSCTRIAKDDDGQKTDLQSYQLGQKIYIVSEVRAIDLDNIQYSDPCTDRVLTPDGIRACHLVTTQLASTPHSRFQSSLPCQLQAPCLHLGS